MVDGNDDPSMPKRPPVAALKAIDQIRAFRSWESVEMYRAVRDALQDSHEYAPEPGAGNDKRAPCRGDGK